MKKKLKKNNNLQRHAKGKTSMDQKAGIFSSNEIKICS